MPSFTQQLPNLQRLGPIVPTQIIPGTEAEKAMLAANQVVPQPVKVTALIDTGATGSAIKSGIAKRLQLNPIGQVYVNTPSSTRVSCLEYSVRFLFPNRVIFETTVIEIPLREQNIQCLIGRDVLALSVFVYVGYTNTFTLSF